MRPPPTTLPDRFARILEDLREIVAREGLALRIGGPLILLICRRLRRLGARFAARLARGPVPPRAIRPRALPTPAETAPDPGEPIPASPKPAAPNSLPRRHAWLRLLIPSHWVNGSGGQLQYLLADPEMTALLEADPALGRVLRPLCHILGVRLPPSLQLPRTKRARPARPRAPKPRQIPSRQPALRRATLETPRPQRRFTLFPDLPKNPA